MARPASGPGRLLERIGDGTPRGMTVQDRTRLIGRLRAFPHFNSVFVVLCASVTQFTLRHVALRRAARRCQLLRVFITTSS